MCGVTVEAYIGVHTALGASAHGKLILSIFPSFSTADDGHVEVAPTVCPTSCDESYREEDDTGVAASTGGLVGPC